jgi:hypothetical protein
VRDRREHVSYRYDIRIELTEPLTDAQLIALEETVDEVVMGNLGNHLGPLGYEGYQDGPSTVRSARDGD